MSTAILSVVSGITDKSIIPLPMSTSIIGKSIKSPQLKLLYKRIPCEQDTDCQHMVMFSAPKKLYPKAKAENDRQQKPKPTPPPTKPKYKTEKITIYFF